MEIEVKSFKKALEIVKPGLANKETIEQTTSFAFTEDNVITYNDEICIQHPLKGVKLKGAIQAEELYKFLNRIKTETIKTEVGEDQLTFKSGRSKVQFNIDSKIRLPLDDKSLIKKGKWKEIPEDFLTAINMAIGSASKSSTNAKLSCIHINENGYIEGSDGYRILHYVLKDKFKLATVVVPASSMVVVSKMKPTKVSNGKEWLHFKNKEGTTISCRLLNEGYVNTSPLLKTKKKGTKITLPKELSEILDTAEIFAGDLSVTVTVKKKKLIITAQSETSNFKDEIDIESKTDDFAFQVTPYLLRDILKQTTSCTILNDRLLFKDANWKYVSLISVVEEDEDLDLPF